MNSESYRVVKGEDNKNCPHPEAYRKQGVWWIDIENIEHLFRLVEDLQSQVILDKIGGSPCIFIP
jgi:hypothetical protein